MRCDRGCGLPVALVVLAMAAGAAAGVAPGPARAEPQAIGTATMIENMVTAELVNDRRQLKTGDDVRQNETLETAPSSFGEFQLKDDTKLALGPGARIVLDKFVYDPDRTNGSIVINLAKGAFRFITGKASKPAYEIRTPTSTLTVRGTIFDLYIDDDGEAAVLLVEGGVDVCNRDHRCMPHNQPGMIMHVGRRGDMTPPRKWDGSFMRNVPMDRAFPFMTHRLRMDPRQHFRRADLMTPRYARMERERDRQRNAGRARLGDRADFGRRRFTRDGDGRVDRRPGPRRKVVGPGRFKNGPLPRRVEEDENRRGRRFGPGRP